MIGVIGLIIFLVLSVLLFKWRNEQEDEWNRDDYSVDE